MNGISPDVPAWLAYLVVFAGGLVTAMTNVRRLVGEHSGYWRMPRTWLLFFLYLSFPLALYWVLDRLGALHDTSLVAALLVGFAYQQVMTGGITAIPVPGGASQFWQPFQTIAEGLAETIAKQWRSHLERIYDRMYDVLSDDAKVAEVTALAFEKSDNAPQLKADLDGIDKLGEVTGEHVTGTRLEDLKRKKKTERLLRELRRSSPEHWGDLLRDQEVLTRGQHFLWVRHGREAVTATAILIVLGAGLAWGGSRLVQHEYQDAYYRWRLVKANATAADRYRTWRYFAEHQREGEPPLIAASLGLLEANTLPPGVVDEVFRVFTYVQKEPLDPVLARSLVGALRTPDVGVRLRVQQQLLRSAADHPVVLADSVLLRWVPSEKDTPAEIRGVIRRWTAWLEAASADAAPPSTAGTAAGGTEAQ